MVYGRERQLPLPLRPWLPFVQTTPRRPDGTDSPLDEHETFWVNAHYLVHKRLMVEDDSGFIFGCHLSLRTVENDTRHDWRDMQRIKTELLGPDWEAIELYPAESRVVDTANQYHLFCFPPGTPGHEVVGSIGFQAGRMVTDDPSTTNEWLQALGHEPVEGATQRPL